MAVKRSTRYADRLGTLYKQRAGMRRRGRSCARRVKAFASVKVAGLRLVKCVANCRTRTGAAPQSCRRGWVSGYRIWGLGWGYKNPRGWRRTEGQRGRDSAVDSWMCRPSSGYIAGGPQAVADTEPIFFGHDVTAAQCDGATVGRPTAGKRGIAGEDCTQ